MADQKACEACGALFTRPQWGSRKESTARWQARRFCDRQCSNGSRKAPDPICSVEGCEKPSHARGWCAMHVQRWYTTGEPGEAEMRRIPSHPDNIEKRCTVCRQTLPLDEFHRDARQRDGRQSQCRSCYGVSQRAYVIRRKYGLSMEQYDQMLVDQGERCAICGADCDLVIDHCHDTGVVRALVCDPCNRAMGCVGDDPARLRAAADYLEVHRMLTHDREEAQP